MSNPKVHPFKKPVPIKRAQCQRHGSRPSYIACLCVLEFGAEVRHVISPTQDRFGEILCIRSPGEHQLNELRLLCDYCARDTGLDKVGGKGRVING